MVNVGGLSALNAVVGLAALFFVLSTAISAINEGIANLLGWRAKTLEDAVRRIIGDPAPRRAVSEVLFGRRHTTDAEAPPPTSVDPVPLKADAVFDHWRIKGLVRDPTSKKRRRSRPSYLPPRAFSLALSEVLAQHPNHPKDGAADETPWATTDAEILAQIKKANLPKGELNDLVQKAAGNAFGSLEGFRVHVERVFDDTMERASGWYKRKVQATLLVLAAVIVIGFNVDTVHVGSALWNDDALRTAVATQASSSTFDSPKDAADALDQVSQLKVPMGWGDGAEHNVLGAIPGWLITIAALNLGAPFWFDALSRLARMRGSGVPERPRSLSDTAGTVEKDRDHRATRAAARVAAAKDTAPTNGAAGDVVAPPAGVPAR
jgi:hypothetical protein